MSKQEFKALSRTNYLAICYAHFNGAGIGSISEVLGVTKGIVVKVKKHSGVSAPGFPNPARTGTKLLSTKEVRSLLALRAGGMSAKEAGKLLEVSAATVSYIEDESFNVPAKLRFGTHEAKLARAQVFAATCPANVRNVITREYEKEPDVRAVARMFGMCEYRVRAILNVAVAPLPFRSSMVQGRSVSGQTILQRLVNKRLSPAQRRNATQRLDQFAEYIERGVAAMV